MAGKSPLNFIKTDDSNTYGEGGAKIGSNQTLLEDFLITN
jgi:hypothetical protein